MQITIHADKEAKQLTITVHGLDWAKVESGSFAAGEETIQELLAQSGRALTPQLLESNEFNEGQLEREGRTRVSESAESRSLPDALRAGHRAPPYLSEERRW